MRKQSEITDKTRQALIDAFCLLYSQKPIKKISIQEITKKQDIITAHFIRIFSIFMIC
jgi:hypothetical protein